jgi:hypothetical protein
MGSMDRSLAQASNNEAETVTVPLAIPRSALTIVAPPPDTVSQKTSLAVLGIDRRPFLAALPAFRADGGAVFELGRLRLVRREAFVAWLGLKATNPTRPEEDGAVSFVRELGLRVVEGGAARR